MVVSGECGELASCSQSLKSNGQGLAWHRTCAQAGNNGTWAGIRARYLCGKHAANISSYCAARLNVSRACLVGELACLKFGAISKVAWHLHMQKRMPIGNLKLSDPQVPGSIPTDANHWRKSCRTRIQATRRMTQTRSVGPPGDGEATLPKMSPVLTSSERHARGPRMHVQGRSKRLHQATMPCGDRGQQTV